MLRTLIFSSIFFTPFICGSNSIPGKTKAITNVTLDTEAKQANETKLTVVSEGGSIVPEAAPSLTLSTKKHMLLNLDKELGKNKEKPVVPRKGVVYDPLDENISVKAKSSEVKESAKDKFNRKNTISEEKKVNLAEIKDVNKTTLLESNSTKENKTKVHKKPLLLSNEALDSMNNDIHNNDHIKLQVMKSSSKTFEFDQMPSPNKENEANIHSVNKHRHPGMIMPIIITILVVPMFAVLGYMALRRGQEAWKNRHYKRMDFLLDGMYND